MKENKLLIPILSLVAVAICFGLFFLYIGVYR